MYGGGSDGKGDNAAGDSHESVEPRWTPPSSGVLLSPVSVVSNTQNSENLPQNHNHAQPHDYQHHVSPRNGAYESPYSPIYQQRMQNQFFSQIFMHKSAMQSAMHARDLGPGGLGRPGGVPGGLAGLGVGVGVGPGGMITGNEVKPHQCQQCLKSFSSNHQLVQHIRVHTGERPYKCHLPDCGRAFIQLSNLQQHLRNHDAQVERAKNRPFHCGICGKGFATESSLRTHTSKVSHQHAGLIGGPNATSCPICHKLFLGGEALMEHMKITHKDPNASGVANSLTYDALIL